MYNVRLLDMGDCHTGSTLRDHLLIRGFGCAGGGRWVLSSNTNASDSTGNREKPKQPVHAPVRTMSRGAKGCPNDNQ